MDRSQTPARRVFDFCNDDLPIEDCGRNVSDVLEVGSLRIVRRMTASRVISQETQRRLAGLPTHDENGFLIVYDMHDLVLRDWSAGRLKK